MECEGGIGEGAKAMARLISVVSLMFAIAFLLTAALGWYEGAQPEHHYDYLGEGRYRKYTVEAEIVVGGVFLMIGVACWGLKSAKFIHASGRRIVERSAPIKHVYLSTNLYLQEDRRERGRWVGTAMNAAPPTSVYVRVLLWSIAGFCLVVIVLSFWLALTMNRPTPTLVNEAVHPSMFENEGKRALEKLRVDCEALKHEPNFMLRTSDEAGLPLCEAYGQ